MMKGAKFIALLLAVQFLGSAAYCQDVALGKTRLLPEKNLVPRDPQRDWELVHGSLELPYRIYPKIIPSFVHGIIDNVTNNGFGVFHIRSVWTESGKQKQEHSPILSTKVGPRSSDKDVVWVFVPENAILEKVVDGKRVNAKISEFSVGVEIEFHPTERIHAASRGGINEYGYLADSMLMMGGKQSKTIMLNLGCKLDDEPASGPAKPFKWQPSSSIMQQKLPLNWPKNVGDFD